MSEYVTKAEVTLDSVPLAATQGIVWRLTTGTAPYTTVLTVHKSKWEERLSNRLCVPLTLKIVNGHGVKTEIKEVYILHKVSSISPNLVSFIVSDRRWKWAYKFISRDYNIPRKTGDRTAILLSVPIELQQTKDVYDFYDYSLNSGKRWTPKEAIADALSVVERHAFEIRSLPTVEDSSLGQFTMQGVTLRDSGDSAIARLLSYIPGASIYVNIDGKVIVFDATSKDKSVEYFNKLPDATYSGGMVAMLDRKKIRPKNVVVHYQKEIEVVFSYYDDYTFPAQLITVMPNPDSPYLENVLPTVDPETEISEHDGSGNIVTKKVPPGTWVRVESWLHAMNAATKAPGSLPWSFDTISRFWMVGDLDGVLGARGTDYDEDANYAMRVQALKQHFRQTFRINPRYMKRIRKLMALRVALIDPVTGARAPATVWGQICVIPSAKGRHMSARTNDPIGHYAYRNVDNLAKHIAGQRLIDTVPGPGALNILDREQGIFRVDWIPSPYGDVNSIIPCLAVGENNYEYAVPNRDLALQKTKPMGSGIRIESGTNGICLSPTMELKAILTIVPSVPNNRDQYYRETVPSDFVAGLYKNKYWLNGGEGPDLEIFVPPGESTARYAWRDDTTAEASIKALLGFETDNRKDDDNDKETLQGFVIVNRERQVRQHAYSYAAEMLSQFSDDMEGVIATKVPEKGFDLDGSISSVAIRVAQAPSAKVDVVHQFTGESPRISRMALMPDSSRAMILGTIPFEDAK